jgi:hypothetical protein
MTATTTHPSKHRYARGERAPRHVQRPTRRQDWLRAVAIIAMVVVASLAMGAMMHFLGPKEEPVLPEARTATGAEAPAIPVPPIKK